MLKLLGEEEASAILSLPQEEPDPEESEEEEEASFENETHGGQEDGGGVAIAPPPPPPPNEQTEDSLSEALMFYLEVWEDCVTASDNWADRAEYCLGKKFEEWTPPEGAEPGKQVEGS